MSKLFISPDKANLGIAMSIAAICKCVSLELSIEIDDNTGNE